MPGYKKKVTTYKKKGRYVKKTTYKKKGLSDGTKALRIAKSLLKAVEYKHTDYPLVADDVSVTGVTYPLVENLSKGLNAFERIGDNIKLARAHIDFTVYFPTGGSPPPDTRTFRVLLCRGIRENSVPPTMTTGVSPSKGVLDTSTVGAVIARKSLDNIRDTKILLDKVYTLTPGQATKKEFRWNFKCGWTTKYATGTSNKVEDGGLYLMLAADFNSGDMLVTMNNRITYSDD